MKEDIFNLQREAPEPKPDAIQECYENLASAVVLVACSDLAYCLTRLKEEERKTNKTGTIKRAINFYKSEVASIITWLMDPGTRPYLHGIDPILVIDEVKEKVRTGKRMTSPGYFMRRVMEE